MATTISNTVSATTNEPAKVRIVNTIPDLADTEIGEIYLLISDSHTDDKKLHIRFANGWLKSAAFS